MHEQLENWLGALLPPNVKELPPVPEQFLRAHNMMNERGAIRGY